MSKEIDKVLVTDTKVTLKIVFRDAWGIYKRQQMTFSRRQFEVAMRDAQVTVPWNRVHQP